MSDNATSQSPLFRQEVTSFLGQQWLGTIRLTQPLSSWLIAGVALAITSVFIAFVLFGSVTKKAHVTGVLVPSTGSLGISTPNAGILIRNYVTEGQQVRAGEPLFELSSERQGSNGELTALIAQQLNNRAHSLESERGLRIAQHDERKAALTQRLHGLDAEGVQLEQEAELVKRRLALAQQSLGKYETLQASGYVSAAQTQQQQEALIDLKARLSNLGRNAAELRASRQDVASEMSTLTTALATDLAQLQRTRAALEQEIAENNNRKSILITAPQSGTVTTITYQAGQALGNR
jgi:membrane fusion protein